VDRLSHDETVFPVTHSILSPRALRELAESEYDVGSVVRCQLLKRGMNDTYLLETAASRYVLRVYRTSWRSQPEILGELELLLYLHDSGIDVSTPLRRRAGDLLHGVIAPEGPREVALFTYAQGATPPMDDSHGRLFGGALAQLHTAMDSFPTSGPRFALDLDHLVRRPLQAIAAAFQHRPADIAFLQELGKRIELRMAELEQDGLTSGICHGDPWLGNVHMDRSERLTWFDFDYCGFGWRAL
jgi:Ser/Thr protein kinase RdoA (MazF antagonist)